MVKPAPTPKPPPASKETAIPTPKSNTPCSADRAIDHVRAKAKGPPLAPGLCVTINFHPDALHDGAPMIASLARDGFYRSQFETGISNGALATGRGAGRWLWESRVFGGAYEDDTPAARPKYGALNHANRITGGSPRFGSAHLRLKPGVLPRTTFCHPDSHLGPHDFGVADRMGLLALLGASQATADPLDHYIEAHIHGPLSLKNDVHAIVLDPSHRGTAVEDWARALGCATEWHPGFRMSRARLDDCARYRDKPTADLARSLFDGEFLTPSCLGKARRNGPEHTQTLKRVWHCIARFGPPDAL
ncbi:DUF3626 domain-containing protein [Tropicibacter oceani]|uniref:DUF3626 domain-containing protein n=1 Tax=Tropicibacter oceani TaxID=3058420 RepID=A0ABY8QNK0_9RHOB|nr:DUF3626 domain-containing protein [Tropicibacter oceani]WGW05397.1 DUF3626 domain-containing protein [Tropicibacter oceani]